MVDDFNVALLTLQRNLQRVASRDVAELNAIFLLTQRNLSEYFTTMFRETFNEHYVGQMSLTKNGPPITSID